MTVLQAANAAFREGDYARSVELYGELLSGAPEWRRLIQANLEIARQRAGLPKDEPKPKKNSERPREVKRSGPGGDPSDAYVRVAVDEPVSIIVPIYNALDDLRVCVARLLKYTPDFASILLINDASTDPEVVVYLDQLRDHPRLQIFHNMDNLGFTRTVNRGIQLAEQDDVVLLNSDARVTPRWLEGLQYALSFDSRVATVTPMSDRAGAFSAPQKGNENELPEGLSEENYAVAFRRHSAGHYPSVPTGNGYCLYIRRKSLNDVGPLDEVGFPRGYGEENDFCMRAGRRGWRHVVDDRTYVFHDRSKSFGEQKTELIKDGRALVDARYPEYKKAIRVFSEGDLLADARTRAGQALEALRGSGRTVPRALYVINSWTGGTPQTNKDLMIALQGKYDPWLLRCDAQVMSLYRVSEHGEYELNKEHKLREPVDALHHTSPEYDKVLNVWLRELDFELVHIRHIGWHSLSLARLAKKSGSRVVFSFHDYYSICPTVKLLDETNTFCGGACTSTSGDCTIDLWKDKQALPQLKHSWVYRWRERFQAEVLNYVDAFVTTHTSVRDTILRFFDISVEKFSVIPHGRNFKNFHQMAAPVGDQEPLRVLLPGNLGVPKGRELVRSMAEIDEGTTVEFHILGVARVEDQPGLVTHGKYRREEFAARVGEIRPHVGAVLSLWNETWCHTLTELWAVGLPAVVTDFPTLSQRVQDSGGGWVTQTLEPQTMLDFFRGLRSRPAEIRTVSEAVTQHQQESMAVNSVEMMAERYADIYSRVVS